MGTYGFHFIVFPKTDKHYDVYYFFSNTLHQRVILTVPNEVDFTFILFKVKFC